VKALTGGDPITARFMRQDFFTYRPQFKLFVAGNHKPSLRNIDDAIRRRLHLIPFTFRPARPDRDLPDKLKPEWPAILPWAIQGCLEWQRLGLAPPPAVVEATAAYFAEEDAVGRWLEERCRHDANATATTHDLFADWRDWCAQTGEQMGTEKRFVQALIQRGYERWQHPKTRKMGFREIELLDEFEFGPGAVLGPGA
jgi:putative DNA primase/helicase